MIIDQMTLGPIQANCYILGCEKTKNAVVIDPGDEPKEVLMALAKNQLTLKYIINTHGHFDHVGGNRELKRVTGAAVMIHDLDKDLLKQSSVTAATWGIKTENISDPDEILKDNDKIFFGQYSLEVIHTPGHTSGGISLYSEFKDNDEILKKVVFVGDTLFAGSVGRTDLPGGSMDILLASIRNRLFKLEDDVIVYPGHMHQTTIGAEKAYNPFCGVGR